MSSALSRAGCCFTRGSALHKDYTMNIYGSYSLDLHGSASASVFYLLMLSGIQGCKSYETIVEKPRGYAERVWSPRWPCILPHGDEQQVSRCSPQIGPQFYEVDNPVLQRMKLRFTKLSNHPRSCLPYRVALQGGPQEHPPSWCSPPVTLQQ